MRTTIDITDATLTELRSIADQKKRPFREIVEETLQRGLATAQSKRKKRIRISPVPIGLKPGFRGMSMNQLYDQLEAEDQGA
ncbi:MAG: hypothetical protein ACI8UO_001075 [Verrucomicrobiales bacterium]|jgi:hypothetical protein